MKILLMCSAGMSTSLLVVKMEKYAKENGISDIVIKAQPIDDLEKDIDNFDVFLLGPQVKYKENWVKGIVEEKHKKYACIPPQVYGLVDGKKAMELALDLLK